MSDKDPALSSRGLTAVREEADELRSDLTDPAENRAKQWLLLTGHRWAVTAVLLVVVFLALLAASFVRPYDMRRLLAETNAIRTLFSSLLSGAILLVSIVVSINSVVLSQEITDLERQRERIRAAIDYRDRVGDFVESGVVPARPASFLPVILFAIHREAGSLERAAAASGDGGFREQAQALLRKVDRDVEQARSTLADVDPGGFRVLLAGLNYDYSRQLHAARALEVQYGDATDSSDGDVFTGLIETLTLFGTARGYIESLYFKQELASLSRRLLLVSLPVIVFASYVLLALDAKLLPQMTAFGLSPLLVFVSLAYTVALAPYVVLTTHILRATTVTLRTLAAGPFTYHQETVIEGFEVPSAAEAVDWEDLGDPDED